MKTLIAIMLAFAVPAFGADSLNVPIRYFNSDGHPLNPHDIKDIHFKDCIPNGWRFELNEWRHFQMPAFYLHPKYGPNGGYMIA